MKKVFIRFSLLSIALLLSGAIALACEIDLKVSEKYKKESYPVNDVIVIEVKVVFDHRDCSVAISETKFNASGCKIVGATKWTESKPNTYHRKLQVKVIDDKKSVSIVCKRSCDKEGGYGKILLN